MRSSVPVRFERALGIAAITLLTPRAEAAGDAEDPFREPEQEPVVAQTRAPEPARTPRASTGYQHWLGGMYVGKGLRFNNPYRLGTVLGDDAKSLSLSATDRKSTR